jgi:F420-dependent oxidoreductase-like protein
MRFGLQLPNFTHDVPDTELFERVVEHATAAEDTGFGSVWVMDHLYQLPPLGGPDQPMLEGYTLLGALAARTERVQLGTLVTGVTYRNPALLAKMVTTLDVISSGRAILGIGAAWYDVEHEGLGFAFPPVGERMDRLEEAVTICRAMFTEDRPTFEGTHYTIREARNLPRPIRPDGIPIMIGGGGEQRTLRLVARYADAWNIAGDLETVRHKIEVLHRRCAEVDRDPGEITVTRMSTLMLTDSPEQTAETRAFLSDAAGPEAAAGFTIGQADEVAAEVETMAGIGVDEMFFNMPFADTDGVRRAGELLH